MIVADVALERIRVLEPLAALVALEQLLGVLVNLPNVLPQVSA